MNQYKKFYSNIFLISIVIFSLFVSCNHLQKDIKNKLKTAHKLVVKNQNLPIIVTGITDDPKAFKYFNWLNMSYFFGENHKIEIRKIKKDSLFIRLDSIKQSGIMAFTAFGDSATYVNKVFVTPGDSLLLRIKNKKLRFIGKNATMYNFFMDMDTLKLNKPYYKGNLEDYKTKCKILFEEKSKFLNKYLQKHTNIPNDFKVVVAADFKYEYLKNLMFLWQKNVSRQKTIMQILSNRSEERRVGKECRSRWSPYH